MSTENEEPISCCVEENTEIKEGENDDCGVVCKDGVCKLPPKRKMKAPGECGQPPPGLQAFDQIFSQLFSSVLNPNNPNNPNNPSDIESAQLKTLSQLLNKNSDNGSDIDANDANYTDDEDDGDDDEDDEDDEEDGDCCHRNERLRLEAFNKLLESHVNLTHSFSKLFNKD